jgi:putative FmdB family regulatory protein
MPLYEYQCESCAHRFEKIQKFSDPLVDVCPACGGGPVKKLLSSPAIQFKGSGFYITDYAKKSGDSGGSSKSTTSSSSSSSSTSSDTSSSSSSTSTNDSTTKKD